MTRRQITAGLLALALGAGFAGACGDNNREQEKRGNPGQDLPEGTPATVDTGPAQIVPTGETEPRVTQPSTGP